MTSSVSVDFRGIRKGEVRLCVLSGRTAEHSADNGIGNTENADVRLTHCANYACFTVDIII